MLKFAGLFFLAAVPCLVLGQARSGTVPRPLAITHAVELGKIRVEAQGAGISSVLLDVTRLSAEPLRVVIPAGTFFANSTSAQDMVAARETVVDLTRGKLVSVRVSALCANFGKAAPDARSSFGISALPDSEDLKKLIPVLKAGKSTQPVAQVAVWRV